MSKRREKMFWNKKKNVQLEPCVHVVAPPINPALINEASTMSDAMRKIELADIMKDPEIKAKMAQFEEFSKYLESKGLTISPSGAGKSHIIHDALDKIVETGTDTFHFGRGIVRTVTSPVKSKIKEITERGA
jgi:hypothetical protein